MRKRSARELFAVWLPAAPSTVPGVGVRVRRAARLCGSSGVGLCALLSSCQAQPDATLFAVSVAAFTPGEGAGFGADAFPEVVLGPPVPPQVDGTGSLDVLSLGAGGVIVLRMGTPIVDGDGGDIPPGAADAALSITRH